MVKLRLIEGLCEFFKTVVYHRCSEEVQLPIHAFQPSCHLWVRGEDQVPVWYVPHSIYRGAEVRCLLQGRRARRDHGHVPRCSGECFSLGPSTWWGHRWWNTQAARILFSSLRSTALVLCHLRAVWHVSWAFITHPLSLPENCLCCGDFLSIFLVSDSPWLLKCPWPCFTDSRRCPGAPDKPDGCWMESTPCGKPGNCPVACLTGCSWFFRMGFADSLAFRITVSFVRFLNAESERGHTLG